MNTNKRIGLLGTAILLSIVWGPTRPIIGEPPHPTNPKPSTSATLVFKTMSEGCGIFQKRDQKHASAGRVFA